MNDCSSEMKTGVDRLLDLINSRGEIGLTVAANKLKIDKPIVKEWAELLEETGHIIVDITLTEHMLVSKNGVPRRESTFLRKLRQQMRTLSLERPFNQEMLKTKEKELNECRARVDAQVAEMAKLRVQLDRMDEAKLRFEKEKTTTELQAAAERDAVQQQRMTLSHREARLMKERAAVQQLQERLLRKTLALKKREARLNEREMLLAERRRMLEDEKKDAHTAARQILAKEQRYRKLMRRMRTLPEL